MKNPIINGINCSLGFILLAGCQSTRSTVNTANGGLPLVEGSWKFSHLGAPTVWNSDMPDPTKLIKAQFKNAKFVFDREGNGTLSMAGQANTMTFDVEEETAAFLKLRFRETSDQQPLIYDKADRTLMLPMNLEVPGSKGVIPTYFRRQR